MAYYDNRTVRSHNAIYNYIDTERNDGKTWSFKIAGVIRFIKHHKKTIWNRTFVSEKKETKKFRKKINAFNSKFAFRRWLAGARQSQGKQLLNNAIERNKLQ